MERFVRTTILACCLAGAAVLLARASTIAAVADPNPKPPAELLERFLQSAEPPLVSYHARRILEASSMGGRMKASLEAMTYLDPDGSFRFEVIAENGSRLIRTRVLLGALLAEQRTRNRRETNEADLTPTNYDFEVRPGAEPDTMRLRLTPRRRSPMLLFGDAVVTASDADLIRI